MRTTTLPKWKKRFQELAGRSLSTKMHLFNLSFQSESTGSQWVGSRVAQGSWRLVFASPLCIWARAYDTAGHMSHPYIFNGQRCYNATGHTCHDWGQTTTQLCNLERGERQWGWWRRRRRSCRFVNFVSEKGLVRRFLYGWTRLLFSNSCICSSIELHMPAMVHVFHSRKCRSIVPLQVKWRTISCPFERQTNLLLCSHCVFS